MNNGFQNFFAHNSNSNLSLFSPLLSDTSNPPNFKEHIVSKLWWPTIWVWMFWLGWWLLQKFTGISAAIDGVVIVCVPVCNTLCFYYEIIGMCHPERLFFSPHIDYSARGALFMEIFVACIIQCCHIKAKRYWHVYLGAQCMCYAFKKIQVHCWLFISGLFYFKHFNPELLLLLLL